jgi:hypothetical protein
MARETLPDHYATLSKSLIPKTLLTTDVPVTADNKMIREAYKRAAFENHPDRATDDRDRAARTARFQKINEAHFILSNPRRVTSPESTNVSVKDTMNLVVTQRHLQTQDIEQRTQTLNSLISSKRNSVMNPMRLKRSRRMMELLDIRVGQGTFIRSPEEFQERFWGL